jgi:hypothetical protein
VEEFTNGKRNLGTGSKNEEQIPRIVLKSGKKFNFEDEIFLCRREEM